MLVVNINGCVNVNGCVNINGCVNFILAGIGQTRSVGSRPTTIIISSDDGDGGGDYDSDGDIRLCKRISEVATDKIDKVVQKYTSPQSPTPSPSKWLSFQRNVPPVRDKLLQFSFKKKDRNSEDLQQLDPFSSPSTLSNGIASESHTSYDSSLSNTQSPEVSDYSGEEQHSSPSQQIEEDKLDWPESGSGSEPEVSWDRQRRLVIQFLNESSLEELCDVPVVSLVKAKLLASLRPFGDWDELVCDERNLWE